MPENKPSHELRILLVEDHPFQLIGLQMQLNQLGLFHVTPAMDYTEAAALLRGGRTFDLCLCDYNLPDGDSLELIAIAHAQGAIRSAVLFSGLEEQAAREKILQMARAKCLPILTFLTKPICGDALLLLRALARP